MRHTPEGTLIEAGDPTHIGWRIANCPVCGKYLHGDDSEAAFSGHVRTGLGSAVEFAVFGACSEHYEQAKQSLERCQRWLGRAGYCGEWTLNLGLVVRVAYSNGEQVCTAKIVRVI